MNGAQQMKRWQAALFGEVADVLRLEDVELPAPGPGEARVRVLAASLALPDLMMIRGDYPFLPRPPASPGQEVVGIVDAVGPGFPHPVGARIVGNSRADIGIGGFAEYTLVPGWSAMPAIEGLTDEQAAGFPGSFHVAHIGLHHRGRLQSGETLLVLGGAGRTGSAAIQIGKALGATVIATARTEAKADFCRQQGADHVLDLSDPASREEIDRITAGRGVDVVYDTVGGAAASDAVQVLAPGARFLIVGFASGRPASIDAQDLLMRDYAAIGILSTFRDETEKAATVATLTKMLAAEQVHPPVTAVYPFDHVPEALTTRAEGGIGQTVITLTRSLGHTVR
ncbi:NADPH:quinone oxidoreductase family protein [Modestobacter sp. SSW1-42]|uniref:NADPH:quinone oxidoreductase family protein n=1 Tax=Modestobacter sp. SSW1-42 TaxID=596372 RepID=UPI0039875615